jgi:hypothetical protein
MRAVVLALLILAAGCGDDIRASITVVTPDEYSYVLTEMATYTSDDIRVVASADVNEGWRIEVIKEAMPLEGYRLEGHPDGVRVFANDVLGVQFGTAAALESLGYRFRHPLEPYIPARPVLTQPDPRIHRPEIRVRGFQYHTLHPMETFFAYWQPSAQHLYEAKRMIDWTVKNKGNFVQWVALDNIITQPIDAPAWKEHTKAIIDYAHSRGVRVGLNIQLFGLSNLQQAFDLVDDLPADPIPPETFLPGGTVDQQIRARLPIITDGLPFDVYDLSFGEFFNADEAAFIESVNLVKAALDDLAPAAEMHAFIHVGASQEVTYMGETLLYYFLVKYADPSIIHDVHSVMFYTLFDTASGAYHADNFFKHRDYLIQQTCLDRKPAYVPETSYWVAFDNSVPMFMPIYVHNRWYDLQQIKEQAGAMCGKNLDNHTLFTTGWEWGYWLHDTTALRASYELPADSNQLLTEELGTDLAPAKDAILELALAQRQYLHEGNLQAYMQGRDGVIDIGDQLGIVSQPDRVTFEDLADGADAAALERDVLTPLAAYIEKLRMLNATIEGAPLDGDSRWTRELRDGFAIDLARAEFVHTNYSAMLAHLRGDAAGAATLYAEAGKLIDDGQAIVTRRHNDLHDPFGRERLTPRVNNATFYQFGYLYMADTLCYWRREHIQVGNLTGIEQRESIEGDCAL